MCHSLLQEGGKFITQEQRSQLQEHVMFTMNHTAQTKQHILHKQLQVMLQDLGQKISSYASALFQLPQPSSEKPSSIARDPSRCVDYTPDLQSSAGVLFFPLYSCPYFHLQPFLLGRIS